MAITLNKYSAVLPGWAILLIWIVPLALLLVWIIKEEKAKTLIINVKAMPLSYGLALLIMLPLALYTTRVMWASVMSARQVSLKSSQPTPTKVPASDATKRLGGVTNAQISPAIFNPTPMPQRQLKRRERRKAPLTSPSSVSIGGSVDMSGDGCQQKIIGGSNNNNYCAPIPLAISAGDVVIAARSLGQTPSLHGDVDIQYALDAPNGKDFAEKLSKILSANGVHSTIQWFGINVIPGASTIPGLSFGPVGENNHVLADGIEKALTDAGVIKKPIPPAFRGSPGGPEGLTVFIRKG